MKAGKQKRSEQYKAHSFITKKNFTESAAKHSFSAECTMYKNPLFVVLLTYMEILPVGLIVSVIVALIINVKEIMHR